MEKRGSLRRKGIVFFARTLWQLDRTRYSGVHWIGIRLLRTLVLSVQGFSRHNGSLRASALTFFTLFSLVPLAAIAFGIAKGFNVERHLREQILEYFSAQQTVVQQIIDFGQNMLDNTRGDMIAGIGVLALFWAVIKVLSNIENAFNHVWGVSSRSFVRKLTDYLAITLICPLLLILSGSVTVFITTQITTISGRFDVAEVAGPLVWLMLKLLPFVLSWTLFTLVYMIMPNTRVRFSSALLAGVITGTICQLIQSFYFYFQILMSKYNAIYGSFAALPLFLLWMQLTWLVVLAGAEISCAFQHSEQADPVVSEKKFSIHQTVLLCLVICRHVANRFRM
ncbi:YihY/virulence factor BrkB family protein, partial [Desulfosarcina sp. OttesenSCG-928-G17]|nr:YihY/virulence factor BrkB family protein [Desulfosarcina sp. OttesenSCG-928-G17]